MPPDLDPRAVFQTGRRQVSGFYRDPGTSEPRVAIQLPVRRSGTVAYDALIAAPRASLLDFPVLRGSVPGGSVMSGTLSVALLSNKGNLIVQSDATVGGDGIARLSLHVDVGYTFLVVSAVLLVSSLGILIALNLIQRRRGGGHGE